MLNQIIYTRCKPTRDLLKNGVVNYQNEGFGIFSFDNKLFGDGRISDYDLFVKHICCKNASKESSENFGLFNSYEYADIFSTSHYISFEYSRPLCKEPRKDGRGHRSGNFIKQVFIGEVQGYPAEWFGASEFDAYKKNDNYYYMDGESPLLAQVGDIPHGGYVNREKVRQFVLDGRSEAVKAAIWFIIHENMKPQSERKVLVIKDYPENVELWVAAIGYALSPELARKMTFTTNKTGIANQMETGLFLFTDENGNRCNLNQAKNRIPFNMIVGYHPKDLSLKIYSTSPFVLIDGATMTVSFETDSTMNLPYYNDAVKYGADIEGFTTTVLPKLSMKDISTDITGVYDAYKYLLDANNVPEGWDYKKANYYLSIFEKYGLRRNSVLCGYLTDRFLKCYPRFASEDRTGGYPLLKIINEIAKLCGKQANVINVVSDIVSEDFKKATTGNASLVQTWNGLKKAGLDGLAASACDKCLSDEDLPSLEKCLSPANLSLSVTIIYIFLGVLQRHGGVQAIVMSDAKKSFVSKAASAVEEDNECFSRLMSYLKASGSDFIKLSISNIKRLDSSQSVKWEEEMLKASNGKISILFERIRATGDVDINWIEDELTKFLLRKGTLEGEVPLALKKSIDDYECEDQDIGRKFFSAWIGMNKKGTFDNIIDNIEKFELSESLQKELFLKMDNNLSYDDVVADNGFNMTVRFESWAKRIGAESKYIPFAEFWKSFKTAKNSNDIMFALGKISSDSSLVCTQDFLYSKLFEAITDRVAATREFWSPDVHVGILGMFNSYDVNAKRTMYIGKYLDGIITKVSRDDSRHVPELLLSFWVITLNEENSDADLTSLLKNRIRSYAADSRKIKELSKGIKKTKVDSEGKIVSENVKENLLFFLNPNAGEKKGKNNKKCDGEKEKARSNENGGKKENKEGFFSLLFGKKKNDGDA